MTLSTAVMNQAADVIHGLQAQLAAREKLIAELQQELDRARAEIKRLSAKTRRQSSVISRERASW